ncbi:2-oxoglutarate dehydrogenase E1 subunit family protein, partial [Agromyces binzhouensis]
MFGANEWLVDEMYERFLADPSSVDETWREVLEHYRQVRTGESAATPATTPAMPDETALHSAASEQADAAPTAPADQPAPSAAPAAPTSE